MATPTTADVRHRRIAWTVLGIILAIIVLLLVRCDPEPEEVKVVAAGDMVCAPEDPGIGDGCRYQEVSDLAVAQQPDVMFGLGDYVYEVPKADSYRDDYGPSWGRLRDITIPVVGNQEFKVNKANTFHEYFGDRAGGTDNYWRTRTGKWDVFVLNSNCTVVVGGCTEGSPQYRWLAEELAAGTSKCTVALWHHPRWSNGIAGADARMDDLVRLLSDNGVDLGLAAHESNYERFTQLDGNGQPSSTGMRHFVVGTGGQTTYLPEEGDADWRNRQTSAGSEYFTGSHHGFLELNLKADSYSWQFWALDVEPDESGTWQPAVIDSGETACN